jgi:hypothetical protein
MYKILLVENKLLIQKYNKLELEYNELKTKIDESDNIIPEATVIEQPIHIPLKIPFNKQCMYCRGKK